MAVERVESIPPPCPTAARGPIQAEMRHAYRLYEFLKAFDPDLVVCTQAFGMPYFSLRARALSVAFKRTLFVVVLSPFDLQRRFNEHLVTARPYALIRFQLERDAALEADLCIAPSHRFVENAIRTGAMAETRHLEILPAVEIHGASPPVPLPPSSFLIPNVPPLERNIAIFAAVARRHPDVLRNADGNIHLQVDAAPATDGIRAICRERFTGTDVTWSIGEHGTVAGDGHPVLFVPHCEDYFALGGALASVVRGTPVLLGSGTAVEEQFETTGITVPPFPDAIARAITEATEGRRSLRISGRPAELDVPWMRLLENLAPPKPKEVSDSSRVTVCIMHFNRPRLVETALASALEQTWKFLDVLVFDDGSDAPDTIETLESMVDTYGERIRFVHQDNRYLGAARNAAALAASGEFVYFLDDDNVLKPHAIETLVRAAQVSGADFVGSFSDIFSGEEAPSSTTAPRGRILQTGDDAGFSLFNNAVLDGNALYRRDSFLALGGNTEDYGVGKDDQEFFARALHSGRKVEVVPEALFWARHGQKGLKSLHFSRNAGHFRVLAAYWPVVEPRHRALLLLLQGMFIDGIETRNPQGPEKAIESPVQGSSRLRAVLATCRETLATTLIPSSWEAKRIVGVVESRRHAEVRGWILDPVNPQRRRMAAIHAEGLLLDVVDAHAPRPDIARWKGTDGRHGFLWHIPEALAVNEGVRIDVLDAESGRELRGSPVYVRDGGVVSSSGTEG